MARIEWIDEGSFIAEDELGRKYEIVKWVAYQVLGNGQRVQTRRDLKTRDDQGVERLERGLYRILVFDEWVEVASEDPNAP